MSSTSSITNIKQLQSIIKHAQRRTDRYFRLYQGASDDTIKARWFNLAVEHDRIAADTAKKLLAAAA
ncbi:hypothetical protein APY04_1880 [Hyphomicrobium sulfonivorans]|uniref:Uncharacterized protein n=1 Tax=Hyphomicrobium sulfonivorans TaxID=121290 RepID=A0A109BEZ0_HYPSL|nr:hypothetical protein [Hyphomicrobium sulfonivorans]KWT67521.1 hypothetical protein APY04_1880 [Hyphomicrobium sulfonivorans]